MPMSAHGMTSASNLLTSSALVRRAFRLATRVGFHSLQEPSNAEQRVMDEALPVLPLPAYVLHVRRHDKDRDKLITPQRMSNISWAGYDSFFDSGAKHCTGNTNYDHTRIGISKGFNLFKNPTCWPTLASLKLKPQNLPSPD